MNLKECLNITKCKNFSVFVYTKGHVEKQRWIDEAPLKIFDIKRNKKGELPFDEIMGLRHLVW